MEKVTGPVVRRYGFALFAAGATILGELFFDPILGAENFFLFLFAAVMASAWYGGFGPGLLAAVLWASTAQFLLPNPPLSLTSGGLSQGLRLTLLLLEAALIGWVTALARDYRRGQQSLE